jgi:hypothetical protein
MTRDSRGFYGIDGRKMRSSTTILNVLEKEGLHPWIAWTTAGYIRDNILLPIMAGTMTPQQLSEMDLEQVLGNATKAHNVIKTEAGDMGSLIHKVIEEYYKSKSDAVILNDYTRTIPDLTAPILAFMDWQAKYKIVPLDSEHTVFSRIHGYAGTLDLDCLAVIEEHNTDRIIVDFKSSSAIYDTDILQLSSYVFAQMEMTNHAYRGGMIVRLDKKTGLPEEHFYELKDLMTPFKMFLAAKEFCDARDLWRVGKKQAKKTPDEGVIK